jgi:AraC family transcriptional regulator
VNWENKSEWKEFKLAANPIIRIEEHSQERVVSFAVNCRGPEEAAWNLLRDWVTKNVPDYKARRYIGCASKGHHPQGEGHQADEEIGFHEYAAQMFLLADEGQEEPYKGAAVCAAPQGLFLVGDVALNEFADDGTLDIGSSMQKSFGVMVKYLQDMGGYEFDLTARPYFEEHIFTHEWFSGAGELAGFQLWLPIRPI